MLRRLVLTEGDKKQRFRKLIHKNREERRKHDLSNHHLFDKMPPLERIKPQQPDVLKFSNNICNFPNNNLNSDYKDCPSLMNNKSHFFLQNEKTMSNNHRASSQDKLALTSHIGNLGQKDQPEIVKDRNQNMFKRNMCTNNIQEWKNFTQNQNAFLRYFSPKILPQIQKYYSNEMNPFSMKNVGIDLCDLKKNMVDNMKRNISETADTSLDTSSYVHKKFGMTANNVSSDFNNIENKNR